MPTPEKKKITPVRIKKAVRRDEIDLLLANPDLRIEAMPQEERKALDGEARDEILKALDDATDRESCHVDNEKLRRRIVERRNSRGKE